MQADMHMHMLPRRSLGRWRLHSQTECSWVVWVVLLRAMCGG
jgi:hypothetical protein